MKDVIEEAARQIKAKDGTSRCFLCIVFCSGKAD